MRSTQEIIAHVMARVEGWSGTGPEYKSRCPMPNHNDSTPSFRISDKVDRVLINCLGGCGATQSQLCETLGLSPMELFVQKEKQVEEYGCSWNDFVAIVMGGTVPEEFLKQYCRPSSVFVSEVNGYVKTIAFEYCNTSGESLRTLVDRVQCKGNDKYRYRSGQKAQLYGAQNKGRAITFGRLFIVEGQTDLIALDYVSIEFRPYPSYGIPGVDNVKSLRQEHLEGFDGTVYIVKEKGKAGSTFPQKVCDRVRELGFSNKCVALALGDYDDPLGLLKACKKDKKKLDVGFVGIFCERFDYFIENVVIFESKQGCFTPQGKTEPIARAEGANKRGGVKREIVVPFPTKLTTILNTKYPAPIWAVPGLAPSGLLLFAGQSKSGKSSVLKSIIFGCITGGSIFGQDAWAPKISQRVLLIDKEQLIGFHMRNRFRKAKLHFHRKNLTDMCDVFDTWPRFAYPGTKNYMGQDCGLGWLNSYLLDNPDIRVCILDVWTNFKPFGRPKDGMNIYDAEYMALESVRRIGLERNVCIIAVHHIRKPGVNSGEESILDSISGTAAGQGVPNAIWILKRKLGESYGVMQVVGRDIGEYQLNGTFDKENQNWIFDLPEDWDPNLGEYNE